jgi:L-2-hydroxyglutarate oxidase
LSTAAKKIGVIGGGLVGLATALRLSERRPEVQICLLEKEPSVGTHQSGRNSGVIHSGIYYRPGSLKASLCRSGKRALEAFCLEHSIQVRPVGKLIVATDNAEVPALLDLHQRGLANGVQCRLMGTEEAREVEPAVRSVQAIWVPETSIVSYPQVMDRMVSRLLAGGHVLRTGEQVTGLAERADRVDLSTSKGSLSFDAVINCAGLHADRIARMAGLAPELRLVSFRGEYHSLAGPLRDQIHHLVYPVPDPRFPFLGVHLTPTMDDRVLAGPNAVLCLAREGYRWRDVELAYLVRTLLYPGTIRMARRYRRTGAGEMWRSLNKRAYARALARMLPGVRSGDLGGAAPGVRAQALTSNGDLMDDFVILETARMVHLVNAPSPAATACLAIGNAVVDRLETRL